MRLLTSVLASVAMLFAASGASALTFNATTSVSSGRPLNGLLPGDVVTIDIRMSNPAGVAIFGIGGGVQGWDNSVAQFTSGSMNNGPYFCATGGTLCGVGLNNGLAFGTDVDGNFAAAPADVQNVAGVGNYLPIVQAIAVIGRAGNGVKDPGLDGVVNGGGAQFRLVFTAGQVGVTTINIGTNANPIIGNVVVLAGGNIEQAINANFVVSVIPEPGTALLMGLGLAGLAAAGRRE